jgi:hypothetical protein
MADPDVDTTTELSSTEKMIFGHDAVRGPDGKPVEQGVGSAHAAKGHPHHAHAKARAAHTAAVDVETLAKALADATDKLVAATKQTLDAAATAMSKADAEKPAPASETVVI